MGYKKSGASAATEVKEASRIVFGAYAVFL
jgi:hypothetical protein